MITFDKLNKYIIISIGVTQITIQEIYDAIRDFEDEIANLETPKIADCYGKQELGGGVLVGLTLVLYEWAIKFADRPGPTWEICTIRGGNLVAYDADGYGISPITPSSFITTNMTSSSSATINELGLTDLKYRIESLRSGGSGFGRTWYVNTDTGLDQSSGESPDAPLKTLEHALIHANHGDVIVFLDAGPITTPLVVTKSGIHLRGNGAGTLISTPSGVGITIEGVQEVSVEDFNFYGCLQGIKIKNASNVFLKDLIAQSTSTFFLEIDAGTNVRCDTLYSQITGLCAFDIKGASLGITMENCIAFGSAKSGIHVVQGTGITIQKSAAVACQEYGFRIEAGAAYCAIHGGSVLYSNVLGNYLDNGVATYIGSDLSDVRLASTVDALRKIAIATQGIAAAGLK